jgi:hypothetical protein
MVIWKAKDEREWEKGRLKMTERKGKKRQTKGDKEKNTK